MPKRRNLPLLILHVWEVAMGHFRPILHRFGLTDQQWRILRELADRDELEPGQIAEACKILRPSLSGILARLERTDLVRRVGSPVDQRRQIISLTAKGRALVEQVWPLIDAQYRSLEEAIGQDSFAELYRTLENVGRLIENKNPETARKTTKRS